MNDELPNQVGVDAFHDDFISKHASPLAKTHHDPDWATIFHQVDGEPLEPGASWEHKLELAGRIASWLSAALSIKNRRARARVLGLRALAILYYVWPTMLPVTRLEDLARLLMVHRKHLSLYTAEASRILKLHNRKSHPHPRQRKKRRPPRQ